MNPAAEYGLDVSYERTPNVHNNNGPSALVSIPSSRAGTSRAVERNREMSKDEFSDIASIRDPHDERFNGSVHSTNRSIAHGVSVEQSLNQD